MASGGNPLESLVDRIRLLNAKGDVEFYYQAASLAKTVIYESAGIGHPVMASLNDALESGDWQKAAAASNSVVSLYEEGVLRSPRLKIAREIEGDILDIAQSQTGLAEVNKDMAMKQLQLSIAAFLVGAALEDALRRICDANGIKYDTQRTSLSKLQSALYQPSQQLELISASETKQITTWGDTRNKADHGKFSEITLTEVLSMIMGVRAFVEKHLP